MKTPPNQYTSLAIGLHWRIALLILLAFSLGIYMHDLPFSSAKLKFYSWHKWLGVTVFIFVILRTYWRLSQNPTALAMSNFNKV